MKMGWDGIVPYFEVKGVKYVIGEYTYPTVQRVTAPEPGLPGQHTGYGVGQGTQGGNCILKKWHLPLHFTQQNILCLIKAA